MSTRTSTPTPAAGVDLLLDRVDREAAALVDAFFGGQVAGLIATLVVVLAAALLVERLARRLRGLAPARRPLLQLAIYATALLVAISVVARTAYATAPLLVAVAAALGGAGVLFTLGLRLRVWVSAVVMLLSGRLRPGDRIAVDGVEGIIRSAGLFQVVVDGDGAGRLYIPTATLFERTVWLGSPEQAHPVEVEVRRSGAITVEQRRRLYRVAALCPYRAQGSEVTLVSASGDECWVTVRLSAWSEAAARRAEEHLRSATEAEAAVSAEKAGARAADSDNPPPRT